MPMRHNSPNAATGLQDGKPSIAHPANDKTMIVASKTLRMLSAVFSDIQHSLSVGMAPLEVEISRQPMHSDCNEDKQRHYVGHEKISHPIPRVGPLARTDRQAIDDARC
jgi:hypothetical protein